MEKSIVQRSPRMEILYLWGYNGYGQLGDGDVAGSETPKKIMKHVKAVGLGEYRWCGDQPRMVTCIYGEIM